MLNTTNPTNRRFRKLAVVSITTAMLSLSGTMVRAEEGGSSETSVVTNTREERREDRAANRAERQKTRDAVKVWVEARKAALNARREALNTARAALVEAVQAAETKDAVKAAKLAHKEAVAAANKAYKDAVTALGPRPTMAGN
jgi:hypothetical protein